MGDFSNYEEFTWIATIVGVRGVCGELRVKYFTDSPEYYSNTKLFFLENQRELHPKNVLSFKSARKGWLIVLEGIETRDDAEKIKARSQDLTEASMKLGEAIYKAESEKSAEETGEGTTDAEQDADIVDADFEDLDEGKSK